MKHTVQVHKAKHLVIFAALLVVALSCTGCLGRGSGHDSSKVASSNNVPQTVLQVDMDATGANDVRSLLGINPGLFFSTVKGKGRSTFLVDFHNTSDSQQAVDLSFSSDLFRSVLPTDDHFTLNGETTHSVAVQFVPKHPGDFASLLHVKRSGSSDFDVSLRGCNAAGFENDYEPTLQEIFTSFGYKINAGMAKHPIKDPKADSPNDRDFVSSSSQPAGDEVLDPTFQRADPSKPVQLLSLANYSTRNKHTLGPIGIYAAGTNTKTQPLFSFAGGSDSFGGQNQQFLPQPSNGSQTSFVPEFDTFGVWDAEHSVFSEDRLNPDQGHHMRVYPAVDSNGVKIPNTYLVAEDSIGPGTYRNYDFQDFVFLISNVTGQPT